MSEPLSAVEIEDVLSSIRRLVSDDMRPAAPRNAAEGDSGKLILTPALRVVQETPARPADPAIESVVAGLGAAVDARAEDWESETGDPAPAASSASIESEWDVPAAPMAEAAEAEFAEAEPEEAEVLTLQFHARPRSVLEHPAAEHTVSEEEAPEAAFAEEVVADAGAAGASEPAAPVPGWAQDGEDEAPATDPRWAEATIEPDSAWADAAEAEILEELSDEIAAAAPMDRVAEAAEEAGYDAYEDEALRELVRDLIVEELQGPLGARITRNIRKLVRAEIARALAAEQLY